MMKPKLFDVVELYCWGVEVERAMQRHKSGEACVIPVVLRVVDWKEAPFAKLQALPQNAKPVTKWQDQDEAFSNVAQGIRVAVNERKSKKIEASEPFEERNTQEKSSTTTSASSIFSTRSLIPTGIAQNLRPPIIGLRGVTTGLILAVMIFGLPVLVHKIHTQAPSPQPSESPVSLPQNQKSAKQLFISAREKVERGDLNGAIEDYSQGIQLEPDKAYLYFERGQCYQNLGNKESAIADFTKARDLYKQQNDNEGYQNSLIELQKLQQ